MSCLSRSKKRAIFCWWLYFRCYLRDLISFISVKFSDRRNSHRKVESFWKTKLFYSYLQIDLLHLRRLELDVFSQRLRSTCIDSTELKVSSQMNRIKRPICLSFKSLNIAIKVYYKIIPDSFLPTAAGSFYKKRLDLALRCCWRKYNSPFSLHINWFTLVKSLTVSSILQDKPWKK